MFIDLIGEDLATHAGDWTSPGFQALAIHRFGNLRVHKSLRPALRLVHRALYAFARNVYGIELPHNAKIGRRVAFYHQHGIIVHGNTTIGDDCAIHQGVTLGMRYPDLVNDAPTLGRGVTVGAGAKILGAVSIGNGATIGANAVVLCDVNSKCVVVGVPAYNAHPHFPGS